MDTCNTVRTTVINTNTYKYQLPFLAHPLLVLCIVAIPDFDIDTMAFNNLVALMSMQWVSVTTKGKNRSALHQCPQVCLCHHSPNSGP